MKWSDLTLKERKQIYDAVRAENPNASYFDIKSQFDSIPEYEDGGKKIMPPKELGLTPGTPPYLRYLADPGNTYTTKELRDAGFHSAARNKRYLLNPTESKSHMLTLKRALKDSNKISKWSDPVDENMILDYFRSGRANGAVRNQYDLYIDKQRYIDRLNRLVPMEWLLPTIGLGGAEFLREKQNNKSN